MGEASHDGYYHGSSTIQFIGEKAPISQIGTLFYDVVISGLQLVYHALMCGTDDLEVLSVSVPRSDEFGSVSLESVSDGFDGNVTVISIDVLQNIKKHFKPVEPENVSQPTRESELPQILV